MPPEHVSDIMSGLLLLLPPLKPWETVGGGAKGQASCVVVSPPFAFPVLCMQMLGV